MPRNPMVPAIIISGIILGSMEMSTSLRSLNSQPIRVAINRKARAMLHVSEPTIFWVMSPTSMEVPVVNTR